MAFTEQHARHHFTRTFDEIWIGRNVEGFAKYYAPDAVIEGLLPNIPLTLPAYKDAVEQLLLLADFHSYEISETFTDGASRACGTMSFEITIRTTGETARLNVMMSVQIENDLVTHAYVSMDTLSFLEGVKALPPNTLFVCLSGARLS